MNLYLGVGYVKRERCETISVQMHIYIMCMCVCVFTYSNDVFHVCIPVYIHSTCVCKHYRCIYCILCMGQIHTYIPPALWINEYINLGGTPCIYLCILFCVYVYTERYIHKFIDVFIYCVYIHSTVYRCISPCYTLRDIKRGR